MVPLSSRTLRGGSCGTYRWSLPIMSETWCGKRLFGCVCVRNSTAYVEPLVLVGLGVVLALSGRWKWRRGSCSVVAFMVQYSGSECSFSAVVFCFVFSLLCIMRLCTLAGASPCCCLCGCCVSVWSIGETRDQWQREGGSSLTSCCPRSARPITLDYLNCGFDRSALAVCKQLVCCDQEAPACVGSRVNGSWGLAELRLFAAIFGIFQSIFQAHFVLGYRLQRMACSSLLKQRKKKK